jgi:hypothetical protein
VSSAFFTGPDSITALATPPSPRPSAPLREVGCGEVRRVVSCVRSCVVRGSHGWCGLCRSGGSEFCWPTTTSTCAST